MWSLKRFNFLSNSRGATIVEFAVVAPLFFVIFIGILGWAFLMWQLNVLQYATEQTARCSILPKDSNGNKACGSETVTFQRRAAVVPNGPGVTPTLLTPNMTYTQYGSSPTVSKSYSVACINAAVPNLLSMDAAYVPDILRSNYCRPAQH